MLGGPWWKDARKEMFEIGYREQEKSANIQKLAMKETRKNEVNLGQGNNSIYGRKTCEEKQL